MNLKEELKKNYKLIIVLIVVSFLCALMAIFLSFKDKKVGYLIVGDSLIYQKNGNDFKQLKKVPDVSSFKFNVLDGNNVIRNVEAQYNDDKWYFFNENYKELNLSKFKVAYTDNLNISVSDEEIKNYQVTDDKYIREVIGSKDEILLQKYRNSLNKVNFDYDGDGKKETLYSMTNYSFEVTNYKTRSYLFLVDDDKVRIINQSDGINPFTIIAVLDMNGDNKFEVIVANDVMTYSSFTSCYQIYGIKKEEFSLLKGCQYPIN